MEGAILDRKLRYGHERMIMSLGRPKDFESRLLESMNFSFAQEDSNFESTAGYNIGSDVYSVRQQQSLKPD